MNRNRRMSRYRLQRTRSARDAVLAVAVAQLDAMIARLRAGPRRLDPVHEARKCSKRLRSLLRLVREPLGERTFARENAALRDAMGWLSPVRDAEALVESLAGLAKAESRSHRRASPHSRSLSHLRGELRARLATAIRRSHLDATKRRVVRVGKLVRSRVARWPLDDRGWDLLEDGVRAIYRKARRLARDLDAKPTVDELHELRKRAKNLQHLLELLEPTRPPVMRKSAEHADALCDHLGDERDLARLAALAVAEPSVFGAAGERDELLEHIASRRAELLDDARAAARQLFAEKPGAFVRRLRSYWKTWRQDAA